MLIIFFVSFIALFIFYKLPYNIEQDYTASTLDGETIKIQVELKGYRNFFTPTRFKGIMVIDHEVYDVFEPDRADRLMTKLKQKMNGDIYFPIVANKNRTKSDDFYIILWTDPKFKKLYLIHAKNDSRYFAPATNASSANQVSGEIQQYLK
ncbi:hypothetical protein AB4Z30_04525 [Paenibacillus sp. 2TAF8]|jgi:hypothetical protein|uniref:hypothetical protein n=1 Tax=Paenibacillus sp. 2TAF8 TaxID=3233020 RepID=UPI003F9E868C